MKVAIRILWITIVTIVLLPPTVVSTLILLVPSLYYGIKERSMRDAREVLGDAYKIICGLYTYNPSEDLQ